jgi:hypothetical protein
MFQIFSSFSDRSVGRFGLLLYLALLGTAVWTRARVKRARTEWIFVHARSIAEILRVQIAMALAGWREEVADWSFARRQQDLRSLRTLLCGSCIGLLAMPLPMDSEAGIISANDRWLQDQCEYWMKQTRPDEARARTSRTLRWCSTLAELSVIVTASVLAVIALPMIIPETLSMITPADPADPADPSHVNSWGCLLVGVSLAFALGVGAWRRAALDEEDLNQFRRMQEVFRTAIGQMHGDLDHPDATRRRQEILRAAGREQFDEVCDWYARHRDRLPEVANG